MRPNVFMNAVQAILSERGPNAQILLKFVEGTILLGTIDPMIRYVGEDFEAVIVTEKGPIYFDVDKVMYVTG